MITVFNVGQGDAFLIEEQSRNYIIDTGRSNDFYRKYKSLIIRNGQFKAEVDVFLTHHDNDHTGGMCKNLFQEARYIYVPLFAPEVEEIERILVKRYKKIKPAISLSSIRSKCIGVYQGYNVDKSIEVLNPPLSANRLLNLNPESMSIENALRFLNERRILSKESVQRILEYPYRMNRDIGADHVKERITFFYGFFISLSNSILNYRFAEIKSPTNSELVYGKLSEIKHKVCIVLKHVGKKNLNGLSYTTMFSSDADICVFERLVNERVDLKSHILKISHHGSRENTSSELLDQISPQTAIISHGNRYFGKATDCHPHFETIIELLKKGIDIHFSNDVLKFKNKNIKYFSKTDGKILGDYVDFYNK